jgi:hypothetical protein
MAEKRSRLKIRDDGLRETLTDFRGYIAFVELTAVCVVCARFCEMMRPICSNLAYYGQLGSYGFSVFISTDRRASRELFPGTTHTEVLLVSIACDGTVLETDYLDGPPELFRQAASVVMGRKYKQTFMNGVPAEVYTTASVALGPNK